MHEGHAPFWKTANRGKKGISLDVRQPAGRELFLRLIEGFDVLVENFRTGTLDGWGLDLATLHVRNPRLIVLRLTGFTHLSGEADGPPQHMNYPLGDAIAGLFGAFAIAIATALAERNALPREQQQGVEIDLSATEVLLRLLDVTGHRRRDFAANRMTGWPLPLGALTRRIARRHIADARCAQPECTQRVRSLARRPPMVRESRIGQAAGH